MRRRRKRPERGGGGGEVRDADVTLDLESKRACSQTYLAIISSLCVSLFNPLSSSPFAFRGVQIPLQIISIYAKHRDRQTLPPPDNIDSIQRISSLYLPLSPHLPISPSLSPCHAQYPRRPFDSVPVFRDLFLLLPARRWYVLVLVMRRKHTQFFPNAKTCAFPFPNFKYESRNVWIYECIEIVYIYIFIYKISDLFSEKRKLVREKRIERERRRNLRYESVHGRRPPPLYNYYSRSRIRVSLRGRARARPSIQLSL